MNQNTLVGMTTLPPLNNYYNTVDELNIPNQEKWLLYGKLVDFVSRTPILSDFVPAKFENGVWKVLKEPKESDFVEDYEESAQNPMLWQDEMQNYNDALEKYTEAKALCKFEGFIYEESTRTIYNESAQCRIYVIYLQRMTVENLLDISNGLILTQTAKNELGWL